MIYEDVTPNFIYEDVTPKSSCFLYASELPKPNTTVSTVLTHVAFIS